MKPCEDCGGKVWHDPKCSVVSRATDKGEYKPKADMLTGTFPLSLATPLDDDYARRHPNDSMCANEYCRCKQ